MRVFIAGASGVLGRSTTRELTAHGHQVVGLVRSEAKARFLEALNAQPVIGDIFDPVQVREQVKRADAVLHLATAIPAKPRTSPSDWITNDRLRRDGTRNLVEACRGSSVRAYVQQSITFLYGDLHGAWADESLPPRLNAITQSAFDGEQIVFDAHRAWGLPAMVLRGASFYSAESWHSRYFIEQIKRRQLPIIGSGRQYWHYLHVDDMARAVVCAIENSAAGAGQVFNVADDEPFQAAVFLNFLAERLDAPYPHRLPVWLATLIAGPTSVRLLTASGRYRTDKIKKQLGWSPQFPTFREGWAEVLSHRTIRTE